MKRFARVLFIMAAVIAFQAGIQQKGAYTVAATGNGNGSGGTGDVVIVTG